MVDETLQNLLFAMILLSAFTGALAFAEPVRVDIYNQPLCIYVKYTDSLDCDWTLMLWTEEQYVPMVGYKVMISELPPNEANDYFQKFTTGNWKLGGFYDGYRKEIHVYLPDQFLKDIWGFGSTLEHELAHAELYVDWIERGKGGKDVGHCPCNFHDGQMQMPSLREIRDGYL